MQVHYFQRYHQKENVATANTLLLLSRLYNHSPYKFYTFLQENYTNEIDMRPDFIMQTGTKESIPDAIISQKSFKIVVEAKTTDWFYTDQLIRHLNSFDNEDTKILLTISSDYMAEKTKNEFEKYLIDEKLNIRHINTTFEELIEQVRDVLDDRDFEMIEILDDFESFCNDDGLIIEDLAWERMRVIPAGTTMEFNMDENIYYQPSERSFKPHNYIGLYSKKSIRGIGKISSIIEAYEEDGKLIFNLKEGELKEEYKKKIEFANEEGKKFGYNLLEYPNNYFFVEKFYETDFQKISRGGLQGQKYFMFTDYIDEKDFKDGKLPETEKIAAILKTKTWE